MGQRWLERADSVREGLTGRERVRERRREIQIEAEGQRGREAGRTS